MATDIATLRATDPAAYQKRIQEEAQKLSAGLAANAPKPPVPAPMNTPAAPTNYGMPTAPTFGVPSPSGVPSPPKDMSGFNSTIPNMGMTPSQPSNTFGFPSVPQNNPVPAPSPAPNLTRTGNSVSGQLTPEQVTILNSLPPEARHNYLMGLTGNAPTAPGMPTSPTSQIPAPNNGYGQSYPTMSPDQIRAEVAAKIAAETAKRATAASQAKTGIQTSYDRLRSTTADTRTLENFKNDQTLSAFNGRSDYTRAMIGREREISDRQQSEDLQTRLANIDVSLQDYINATPEQQRAMENELIRQEREYGLQVAQLTGNLQGGTRTLAASAQDFNQGMVNKQFDRGVLESDRGYNYQTGRDSVLDNRYDKQLDRNNFESDRSYELAKSSQEWGQLMQKETFDFNKAQTIWDNNFKDKSFQQSMNEAAASRGLQWANIDQRDREFIADQAFKEKSWNADQAYKKDSSKEREFDRGIELYKATGQMPSFMSEYGIDVQGLSSPQYADDLNAMYQMLSSGQVKPQELIKQIDDKVKIGAEPAEGGERMKQAIYKLYPNLDPANKKPSSGENPMLSTSGENAFVNGDWLKRAAALGVWGLSRMAGQ